MISTMPSLGGGVEPPPQPSEGEDITKSSPVKLLLERLEQDWEALFQVIDNLETRVKPVLAKEISKEIGDERKEVAKPASEIEDTLSRQLRKIQSVKSRIKNINDRVVL